MNHKIKYIFLAIAIISLGTAGIMISNMQKNYSVEIKTKHGEEHKKPPIWNPDSLVIRQKVAYSGHGVYYLRTAVFNGFNQGFLSDGYYTLPPDTPPYVSEITGTAKHIASLKQDEYNKAATWVQNQKNSKDSIAYINSLKVGQ